MNIVLTATNYIGIVAFAVSGSMKAIRKGMDLLGVITLGFVTALGGGIISNVGAGSSHVVGSYASASPFLGVGSPHVVGSYASGLLPLLYWGI